MTTYIYCRTSEIEKLKASKEFQDTLLNEETSLMHYARENESGPDSGAIATFKDDGERWTVDFPDRPQASRLMGRLQHGDKVLIANLFRMFSHCEDMQQTIKSFKGMGVDLYVDDLNAIITDDNFSLSFNQALKIFTRLEKKRSKERIMAVKENQRRQGRFLGGSRPFGYMVHTNGRLIENPMEQRVLKKILSMKGNGKSLRTISAEVSTPMMPISFKTVQRIIKRHEEAQSQQI